jgi:hypothetical protein
MTYRVDAAAAALTLLRTAHDQWSTDLGLLGAHQCVEPDEIRLRMFGTAAMVVLWARSLDDFCKGSDGPTRYRDARPGLADQLSAARYACNRAVHHLTPLPDLHPGGRSYPKTYPVGYVVSGLRWATESALPDIADETNRQLRQAYLRLYAGRDIGPTLDALRQWFDAHADPTAC